VKSEQEQAFRNGEGDAWYRRNRDHLHESRDDWATRLVAALQQKSGIVRVADIGCANGWRLARLAAVLPAARELVGVDASAEAIADGRRRYPSLQLHEGILSSLPLQEPFDLVIVNFVLHWADRGTLSRCIAEIDRLVNWNGFLVLGDFLPDHPTRRRYHHVPERSLFTYKQDYARAFLGLGLYRELARVTFDHAAPPPDAGTGEWLVRVEPDSRAVTSLLHKCPDSYLER
jgi:SAM-dependent methyltransferase